MKSEQELSQPARRPRYVWDPVKLAWVEASSEAAPGPPPEAGSAVLADVAPEPAGEMAQKAVETRRTIVSKTKESVRQPRRAKPIQAPAESEEVLAYKGALIRVIGLVVDFLIIGVIQLVLTQFLGEIRIAVALAIYAAYFFGFWAWRGQTPGKMVVGARIANPDGTRVNAGRAFLRCAVYMGYFAVLLLVSGIWSWLVPLAAILFIAFNKRKRGLHDLVAGTIVVNTRARRIIEPEEEDEAEAEEEEDESGT
ncbi:MAG: RDD family protein [Dehalococcoidia bacterium]|nr:RDD family protein [Dehalococcoidia bacterium]